MSNTDNEVVPLIPIYPTDITPILHRVRKADNPTGNRTGKFKVPLFLGMPGLGKTDIMKAFAEAMGMIYIDFRLAYRTFNDVRGYAFPDKEEEIMKWFKDQALPPSDCDKHYLFHWEELLNANPNVLKVAQEAILDRRIGDYQFPRNCMMVASANGLKHHCQAARTTASIMDRFQIFIVEPSITGTQKWLMENAKTEYVLGFLKAHNEALYCDNMSLWDGEQPLSSSRSYANLDTYLSTYDDPLEMTSPENLRIFKAEVGGCIGGKAQQMFTTYMQLYATCGNVEKMLEDARHCDLSRVKTKPDMKYIIASKLVGLADKDNVADVLLLARRLTDPDLTSNPDVLQSMESLVGNRLRRSRADLSGTPAMVKWQLDNKDELLS